MDKVPAPFLYHEDKVLKRWPFHLGWDSPAFRRPCPAGKSKHPRMKLCSEEEAYLRHGMYDEVNYQTRTGPAKRLQLQHRVPPANLAVLIAAGIPDPADQEAAGHGPPPAQPPTWPWSDAAFRSRLAEARAAPAQRDHRPTVESQVLRSRIQ